MKEFISREFICIVCPMGCQLAVSERENGDIDIEGHKCKRGEIYAKQEITDPRRVITSTVKVENGFLNLVPVKTDKEIPKDRIFDVMMEIGKIQVEAPVKIGTVLIENVLDTGSNIVTTRDIDRIKYN